MRKPLFVLDEPHPHRIRFGELHRFFGIALALDGPPIDAVEVWRDGAKILEAPANLPCAELAGLSVPRADTCRFDFTMLAEDARYELRANGETQYVYEVTELERRRRIAACVDEKPVPAGGDIALTQGIANPAGYRDSIVSGVFAVEAYLRATGYDPANLRTIVDVGCGTGRVLLGFHCDGAARDLIGTDIDEQLIAWNRTHLDGVARWEAGTVEPPLPLADASADLVLLISVFTHLPLDLERAWVAELQRVLRPGGNAIVSLHGDLYASLLLDASGRETYEREGYVQNGGGAHGSQNFGTFHHPRFARELFAPFARATMFERGIIPPVQRHFPVASLQDVWVLTR